MTSCLIWILPAINPLDTSCDHLVRLDSPSLSSEPQHTSSVDSVENEFLPESEGKMDHTKLSPTDIFSGHHDYELLLLQKKIDAPNGNLNHQESHNKTELCITKYIPLCDSAVHTGTTSSVPSSSSETNRVSNCHSSLVTTPSSSIDLTSQSIPHKDPMQHVDKNGEHYGENWHNISKNRKNSD